MTRMKHDVITERYFEAGVSMGALFPGSPSSTVKGVPWSGLTKVTESPEGGDANDQYADNIKYLALRGAENTKGTIESFYYPDEFLPCMGLTGLGESHAVAFGQQRKKAFSLAYITQFGNDEEGTDFSEKLHIIYNATCSPVERSYETINDSPEAMAFSFEFDTTPLAIDESKVNWTSTFKKEDNKIKPTASVTLTRAGTEKEIKFYDAIKDMVYGTESEEPKLPMLEDIINKFIEEVASN